MRCTGCLPKTRSCRDTAWPPGGERSGKLKFIPIDIEEKYKKQIVHVKGDRDQKEELFLFAISTCIWCKRGKRWLDDRGFSYSYLDIDKIPVQEKNLIRQELGKILGETPSMPFLIIDDRTYHSGYVPFVWEELLNAREEK
jgi:glutaredoxin